MTKKVLGWDVAETKNFLKFIFQNEGKSFLWIFENWALKNSRGALSVRNYFYKLCKALKQIPSLAFALEVSQENLKKLFSKRFDKDEEIWLLENILPLKNQKSVRCACLNLAGGDAFKMVKFQNKFRHLLKTQKTLVENVIKKLESQGIETRNPFKKSTVVKIKSSKDLSDGDIQGLFMGLVRLVQEDATSKIELKSKNERQFLISKLESANKNLNKLEEENKNLKSQFEMISRNLEEEKKNNTTKLKELKNFVESKNLQKLKEFFVMLEEKESKLTL